MHKLQLWHGFDHVFVSLATHFRIQCLRNKEPGIIVWGDRQIRVDAQGQYIDPIPEFERQHGELLAELARSTPVKEINDSVQKVSFSPDLLITMFMEVPDPKMDTPQIQAFIKHGLESFYQRRFNHHKPLTEERDISVSSVPPQYIKAVNLGEFAETN